MASASLNAALSLGDFVGPILGGIAVTKYGFERACSLLSVFIIFVGISFIPVTIKNKKRVQSLQD